MTVRNGYARGLHREHPETPSFRSGEAKMHREFTSRVAGQSCPPELEAQIAADMNLVVR
jgi:hypothetical protein